MRLISPVVYIDADPPPAGYVARYLGIAATCEGLIDSGSILALKEVRPHAA